MKKYFLVTVILLLKLSHSNAQTPAISLAKEIAQRMADSLSLTNSQQQQIFGINMRIYQTKLKARSQPPPQNSSLQKEIQTIENKRDSLYSNVLTPLQHQLYLQKKDNLIYSN